MAEPPADTLAWAAAAAGAAVVRATQLSGGNRHGTWQLTFAEGGGSDAGGADAAILRVGGPDDGGPPSPLAREAAAYRAMEAHDLPVPRLIAAHHSKTQDRILVTRLPGTADLRDLSPEAMDAVAADLMGIVAAVHAISTSDLPAPVLEVLGAPGPRDAHVAAELDRWARRYHATGRPDPLIELAVAWCRVSVPDDDRPACVVHSDVGPGNFLHDSTRVTGLVDWELAHLGDPMDDLAAFAMRMVHGGMDGFPALARAYGAAAGEPVDPQRLAFHQVLAALRIAIMRHVEELVVADLRVAARVISRALHRRMLVEALHQALALPLPAPLEVPAAESAHGPLYDAAASLLREQVLPQVQGTGAAATKAVARVVKHLAEVDRLGPHAEQARQDGLRALLGQPGEHTIEAGDLEAAVAAQLGQGTLKPADALPALAVIEQWDTELLRPAMGSLADRRLPTLTQNGSSP